MIDNSGVVALIDADISDAPTRHTSSRGQPDNSFMSTLTEVSFISSQFYRNEDASFKLQHG